MNLKFVVNDYVLVWNILFQASISERVQALKQKIWLNYKKQYNDTFQDNALILRDPKNFIPDDDTIYNIVMENDSYLRIKKNTEKFRVELLKTWDEYKKVAIPCLKDILRVDIKPYHVLIVDSKLDVVDKTLPKGRKVNTIVWGRHYDDTTKTLVELIYEIVRKEMKNYQEDYKEIVQAVIELAILNEFHTRISKTSHYLTGDPSLKYLKRQIYPYWLMYLGATKEEMLNYMMRDKIAFDIDKYTFEKQLKKVNLCTFIDFCIKNQKYIVKINELEII